MKSLALAALGYLGCALEAILDGIFWRDVKREHNL